ncbi:MAG: 3-methyl-2-oxobutanoate hydroxymethyltransferase [Actinobacteria bacterium]|jgi:3-methyl-2-oxobutanoate hydroxymethyltransferase|nr:3-methyl-2-oxobutanoate hydroxymethyltransferase [Actinomycetota bacterium]MBU1492599.1 3-methyl-2-oxobutanoate hydroxymethyltransferase [Actinomycetota bacterium]
MDKVTAPSVKAAKGGDKLRMVTAYDAPSARIADRAGADIILVGDSVGNAMLGFDSTLPVTMDMMVHHTAAVVRSKPRALVVADMPWMSYHVSIEETIRNAGRFIQEGGAGAVKLEGGRKRIPAIEAVLDAEIPVMGHIGLTPQSIHAMGGYRVQGRGLEAAHTLMEDAKALAAAGVFSLVLEGVPDLVAERITGDIDVPTIGIGAGPRCDGQVLVYHDVLGLGDRHLPKFVRKYADLGEAAVEALQAFFADVLDGSFPAEAETYHLSEEVAAALAEEQAPSGG